MYDAPWEKQQSATFPREKGVLKMRTTRTSTRKRVLSGWTEGVALGAAMLGGSLLSAPQASANCSLTPADDQYVSLLAQNKMVHNADFDDCNEAAEGRWFADQVRGAAYPFGKAKDLVNMVTRTTPMNGSQAEWEVESAVFVYAPQMIPQIKDEAGQKAPAPA